MERGTIPSDTYVSHGDCCVEQADADSGTQQSGNGTDDTQSTVDAPGSASDGSMPSKVVLSCRVTEEYIGTYEGKPVQETKTEIYIFALRPGAGTADLSNEDYDLSVSESTYTLKNKSSTSSKELNIDRTTGSISGLFVFKDESRHIDFMMQIDGRCSRTEDRGL
ncbi:hypothetical protein GCM10007874_58690 [Labrys miyagiensis]|uniref:DUF4352 domain-containing protein n=1 Tax=Labrys miyagiensis TaxID=346912 RepID=A0ABQ6CSY8_9HYPH|nr:hypothetical protein GCM10007874_58690 [Labrys miyagiensis]